MKTAILGISAVAFAAWAFCAPPAQAQAEVRTEVVVEVDEAEIVRAEAERRRAEADLSREEAEARLSEARVRLEEAAREIAELTARAVGESGVEIMRFIDRGPRRAMLGVSIGPVGGDEAREDGVQVFGVTPGGPAEQAGIRSGDVLVALGGARLDWSDDSSPTGKLLDVLGEAEPEAELALSYRRDGELAEVAITPRPWASGPGSWFSREGEGPWPPDAPPPPAFLHRFITASWGDMEMVTLTPELGEYFDVAEGILVVRAPEDPALGLRDGDVIVDIAGREPADPGHVVRILRSYAPGERLVMTVVRKGQRRQLEADIPGTDAG